MLANFATLPRPPEPIPSRVLPLPGFTVLPAVEEDGATFEANARKKAEHYSALAPSRLLLADDSGLEVGALAAPRVCTPPVLQPHLPPWGMRLTKPTTKSFVPARRKVAIEVLALSQSSLPRSPVRRWLPLVARSMATSLRRLAEAPALVTTRCLSWPVKEGRWQSSRLTKKRLSATVDGLSEGSFSGTGHSLPALLDFE